MELPSAKDISHQASMAARHRMDTIKAAVDNKYPGWPAEAKATLIAAYMNASAQFEIALYLREVCGGIDGLHADLQSQSNRGE